MDAKQHEEAYNLFKSALRYKPDNNKNHIFKETLEFMNLCANEIIKSGNIEKGIDLKKEILQIS